MAGEGSVFQRASDGAWIAQISTGGRGSRKYKSRSAKTEREARRKVADLMRARDAGLNVTRQSLGAYLRRWLDESARPTIRPNTYRGYEDVLMHLAPIADMPLASLTAEDIERCLNGMVARKGRSVTPASPKTVRNAQVVLRRALGQAAMRGHVARNVALQVPLRKVPRFEVEALTPARAREILRAVEGDRYEAAFAVALLGLRASEVLGLAWRDVDLEAGTITVRHQLAGSGTRARLTSTKTDASAATIPAPPFVMDRLRAHRARQDAERPVVAIDGGLVFVTPRGLAVNGSWLTKHFQALLAAAGLPKMRLHDLRHGAVTLLVDAGVHPKVATEFLRHAPGSRQTFERYAHVTAGQQRQAADLLQRAVVG